MKPAINPKDIAKLLDSIPPSEGKIKTANISGATTSQPGTLNHTAHKTLLDYTRDFSPESRKYHKEQLALEAMDAVIVPLLEENLFTFDSFQHLDPDWKPRNAFEHWVDTKLFIHSGKMIVEGDYTIYLEYSNGFLGGAFVVVDGSKHYYSQMEMGWTRQYTKPLGD